MSYNVHSLRDNRSALATVVRDVQADIVVVQEAPRRFRWRAKVAALARSWRMLYAAGGLPSLGNVIVTSHRVRVLDTWCIRYPLTPGRHMRGAVFARCSVGGSTFVVAGTHLATDDAERPGQARAFAAAVAAVDDPVIVAADLNETAGGPSWTLVAGDRTDPSTRPTSPASSPSRRIDAIFVDPRCRATATDVTTSEIMVAASDHLPVVVDVRLPA